MPDYKKGSLINRLPAIRIGLRNKKAKIGSNLGA